MSRPLIREMKDGEEPAVARFLERVFGAWPPYTIGVDPADHLRWKLLRRPELRRYQLVAEIDGRIAGTFFVMERYWRVGSRVCRATDGVDNAVDPAFRGRGLFRDMSDYFTRHLRADFECSIGNYTVNPAVRSRYPAASDQRLADPVAVYLAVDDFRRFASELRWASRSVARALGALAVGALRRRRAPVPAVEVRDLAGFDPRFDRLWSEVAPSFHLIAVRDAATLAWRYGDPRAPRYTLRGVEEGDRLAGFAVSRIDRGWAHLVDLVVAPGRHDVAVALAGDVLSSARRAGAAGCRCWSLRRHPHQPALRALGFFPAPGEVTLLARPYGTNPPDLRFLRDPGVAVHVSSGDSDHV